MKKNYQCFASSIACICLMFCSCTKGFLDAKPDRALVVPNTLADFGAMLDLNNDAAFNRTPNMVEWASDDFYITDASLQLVFYNYARKLYTYNWGADLYEGAAIEDWDLTYKTILLSNIVIEGLESLPSSIGQSDPEYRRIKGTALFHRSYAFFNLAQQFAAPYDSTTAGSLPGVPLPITSDVNVLAGRGTLQQTYDRVAIDMLAAVDLLPDEVTYKTRPTKPAAYAFLARFYLVKGNYAEAKAAADRCLDLYDYLIDFNQLDSTARWTFPSPTAELRPSKTDEIIFHSLMIRGGNGINYSSGSVDSVLLTTYSERDLRPAYYFQNNNARPGKYLKGSYSGNNSLFSGLATDEIYLIRAECLARSGQFQSAMDDLNKLLEKRWEATYFIPLQAGSAENALDIILKERRKELIGRGLRWQDLRRLNKDPKYAQTLTRTANGETHTLVPGDKRYVFPIPDNEINASGIEQNPR